MSKLKHKKNSTENFHTPPDINKLTLKITTLALLSALSISISFLESLIPPLPFFPPGAKLGLANIIIMFTAYRFSFFEAMLIAIIKSLFVLITRGFSAFILSLAGTILSALITSVLLRLKIKKQIPFIIIGLIGGIAHNIGQCFAAYFYIGKNILYYAPLLLVFGVATGILTGILLQLICLKIKKT